MRFFSTVFVAFTALVSVVSAQVGNGENPISSPTTGDVVVAGSPFSIAWTPDTTGKVTLTLRNGPEGNLGTVATIATNIDNSGAFTWNTPSNLVSGSDYTVEISWNGGQNFSPRFTVDSDFTATTTTTASTTRTTTAVTSTTVAPNGTATITTAARTSSSTRAPATTSKATGNNSDTEIPDSASAKSYSASFGLIAILAGAMVFFA